MHVSTSGREVSAARVLLATLDLRGTVGSGDATFAARPLSGKILQAKGEYLRVIPEKQSPMSQDMETLLASQQIRPGWSPPPRDFRPAISVEKGQGRLETRRIPLRSQLASDSLWAGLSHVFQLEGKRTNALGEREQETADGITSRPTSLGTPKRLLALVREHWGIENGRHYRRDRSMREDDAP